MKELNHVLTLWTSSQITNYKLQILLSHVVEARIIETLGKKREKYEMLNEPCFNWSEQVTYFSQRFKHYYSGYLW